MTGKTYNSNTHYMMIINIYSHFQGHLTWKDISKIYVLHNFENDKYEIQIFQIESFKGKSFKGNELICLLAKALKRRSIPLIFVH